MSAPGSFLLRTTKGLLSEVGALSRLGSFVTTGELMCKRVLIVSDPGIVQAGLVQPALDSLQTAGVHASVYDEVIADPPESHVQQAVERAKEENIDCVVGLGGGSSMDVAKLVAFLANTGPSSANQSLEDIYGVDNCLGSRLPLIQVPTTAGTGSEVTPISIITTGKTEKKGVVSPILLPDLAILDASLTTSVPPHVTAATGIDAMVHAIEAYTSKLKKNPISDLYAECALRLLSNNIHNACFNGQDDLDARADMLLGSCLAGMAFANAPVAAVHALAYPIGAMFKVPHGLSNSLVLPHVLRFNCEDATAKSQYSNLLNSISSAAEATAMTEEDRAVKFIEYFEHLAVDLKIETKLAQVGITKASIDELAEGAMLQTRLLPNNPRQVTLNDAKDIYMAAL